MKNKFIKLAALCAAFAVGFAACKKTTTDRTVLLSDVPGAVLSVDTIYNTSIDLNTPYDSSAKFRWTAPSYGKDVKTGYTIEFANSTENLGTTSGVEYVLGAGETMYTVMDKAMFTDFAKLIPIGDSGEVLIRVKSYPAYSAKASVSYSNVLKVMMHIAAPTLPSSGDLYIVGDGSHGWNNPVPGPEYKLVKYAADWYGGRFFLTGKKEFLLLPENGSWDSKYCLFDGDKAKPGASTSGNFVFRTNGGDNFITQDTTGWYKLSYNFKTLEYTILRDEQPGLVPTPNQMFIVGDGTPESWTNTPSAAQAFTRINANQYTYTQAFQKNKLVKFLVVNGNWQPQYGGKDGKLGFNDGTGSDPDAIATPEEDGTYTLLLDFAKGTYEFIKQ
jgi:starch-binding outer membrane protein SusE/F